MYTKEVQCNHNEIPAKVNVETGEVTELKPNIHKRNPDAVVFGDRAKFSKHYQKSWDYLYLKTTPIEFKVANFLARRAKPFTNSLEPINDDTTIRELAAYCGISKSKVTSTFDKLFELGVYGKFEAIDLDKRHTKYWILNPYLATQSQAVDKGILTLFAKTGIAIAFKA